MITFFKFVLFSDLFLLSNKSFLKNLKQTKTSADIPTVNWTKSVVLMVPAWTLMDLMFVTATQDLLTLLKAWLLVLVSPFLNTFWMNNWNSLLLKFFQQKWLKLELFKLFNFNSNILFFRHWRVCSWRHVRKRNLQEHERILQMPM